MDLRKGELPMPTEFTDLLNTSIGNMSIGNIVSAVIALVICLVVVKAVLKIVSRLLKKTKLDARIQKYICTGIKSALYVISALIVVDSLGIPITSLVALLSVASLGITLAAEDILANMAGGLVILSARPFNLGDFVEVSGTSGTVREISLNYTKLETPDGLLVMLPNKTLADSQMTNYTALGKRRVKQVVSAPYDIPTEVVKAACRQALEMTENLLAEPAPAVRLSNYGTSAVEYTVLCWANTDTYWNAYYALGENLRTAFDARNITMPYNHLNVHIVETPR